MIQDIKDLTSFKRAIVTSVAPLAIQLDGDTAPLNVVPDSLVDVASLAIGDKVRVELSLTKCIVHDRYGGSFHLELLSRHNRIINGNFRTNQRGVTSGAVLAAGAYGFDRWKASPGATVTLTFSAKLQGQPVTLGANSGIQQPIERANVEAGSYVLSWVGGTLGRVYNVGSVAPSYTASPVLVTIDGTADVVVEIVAIGAPQTVSEVQLERGSTPTPFERIPVGEELALCHRYYQRLIGLKVNSRILSGLQVATTVAEGYAHLSVPLRSSPKVGSAGSLTWTDGVAFNAAINAIIAPYFGYDPSSTFLAIYFSFPANGAARWPGALSTQSPGGFIDFDSEM